MPKQSNKPPDNRDILKELCNDPQLSPEEKGKLESAWEALSPLYDMAEMPPRPSEMLEIIFKGKRTESATLSGNAALLHNRISANREDMKKIMSLADPKKRASEIMRMGKAYGLPVTIDEVLDFLGQGSSCELCDEELEMVVGGKGGNGDDTQPGQGGNTGGGTGGDSGGGEGDGEVAGNDTFPGVNGDDGSLAMGSEFTGTDGDDDIFGGASDDTIRGGEGDDYLDGGEGGDLLLGGEGDDTMDGGFGDGADDLAMGGAGDDTYIWGLSGDGNDTFQGGEGENSIELDLGSLGGSYGALQQALEAGALTIEFTDDDGNPVELTADMWDDEGNLNLPEGVTGTITGPGGETLNFSDVKTITAF